MDLYRSSRNIKGTATKQILYCSFCEECKQRLSWTALRVFTFLPETAVHLML